MSSVRLPGCSSSSSFGFRNGDGLGDGNRFVVSVLSVGSEAVEVCLSSEDDVVDFNSSTFNDVATSITVGEALSSSGASVCAENEEFERSASFSTHPVPVVGAGGTAVTYVVNVVSVGLAESLVSCTSTGAVK